MDIRAQVEELFARQTDQYGEEYFRVFEEFKAALNQGRIRAAEPDSTAPSGWRVNTWVKQGILLGFRIGQVVEMQAVETQPATGTPESVVGPEAYEKAGAAEEAQGTERAAAQVGPEAYESRPGATLLTSQFRDKHTYSLKRIGVEQNVRIVPGGSSIRDGCYVGKDVVCMPPMYVNVGAYVDNGTLIDSHALVGSCAQIGKRCHISAAAQIGGVLEPVGAIPVIIEDDVLVGGNCGIYEGTLVRAGAVLAAGTILTGSTPVYDLVRDQVYRRELATSDAEARPLTIPSGAVVVPGSRAVSHGRGKELGLSLYTPVIIKYRDDKTDQAVRLEELLR